MGSASPMIIPPVSPTSVGHAGSTVATHQPLVPVPLQITHHDSPARPTDGASVSSEGPISTQDAQIMAEAFKRVMREAGGTPVEEGESSEDSPDKLLNRELAEEGRDIKSVSGAKDVKVEGSGDE